MPLSASMVWEVRSTGNDLNSGGFRAGASGTDYSQRDTPLIAFTDLAIDAADATKVSSAQVALTSAHVGNTIRLASGTGFTPGLYEILSVSAGVATLDRTAGTTGSTGGTGRLGGALASLTALATVMVASNKAWIKAGLYPEPGQLAFTSNSPSPTVPPASLIGYNVTRGDLTPETLNPNRPQIRPVGLGGVGITGGGGLYFANLDFAPGNTSLGKMLMLNGANTLVGCKISGNVTTYGIYSSFGLVDRCEITGVTGNAAILFLSFGMVRNCYIHDCSGLSSGISMQTSNGCVATGNVLANLSGSCIGIALGSRGLAYHNTVHNCGSHGIQFNGFDFAGEALGNLLTNNGGYGLMCSTAGLPALPLFDGNAYYSNSSGPRGNLDDTGTVNPVNGSSPYTNSRDRILSTSPYVNTASGDYRLNSTTGGGALCRGAGGPSAWPGLTIVGYPDLGAVQHQDPSVGNIITWLEG